MKKVLAIVLAAVMVLSLAACASSADTAKQEVKEAAEAVADAKEEVAEAKEAVAEAVEEKVEEAAPAATEKKDVKDLKIGFVGMNAGNAVFQDAERRFKEVCEEKGIEYQWVAPDKADSVKQSELLETLVVNGCDAIGVIPYDSTLVVPMQDAQDKGILMASVNATADCTFPGEFMYNGTVHYDVGHDVGVIAAEKLPKDVKYRICVINDVGEAFQDRTDGFTDALDEAGIEWEIVGTFGCNDDIAQAVEAVETQTVADPEGFDLWFFSGGWPVMTDADSLPNLAKWHEEEGNWVFTVDGFPPMEEFFRRGVLDGASGQNYAAMSEIFVQQVINQLCGDGMDEPTYVNENGVPFYSTGSVPITTENWEEKFANMTPWE